MSRGVVPRASCSHCGHLGRGLPIETPDLRAIKPNDAIDRVIGDALDGIAQVGLGVQAVELRGAGRAILTVIMRGLGLAKQGDPLTPVPP